MNEPNPEDDEPSPDSYATPLPQSNERIDVHNLYINAERDGSVLGSSSKASTDTPKNPDPDKNNNNKSGVKILTANFIECTFLVDATRGPTEFKGVERVPNKTEVSRKLKSSEGQHMSTKNHQLLQENEKELMEMQEECKELRTKLKLNSEDIEKRESREKLLESELAELRKLLTEMQKTNMTTNDVKNDNEAKMLSMLSDKEKHLREQQRKIDQLQTRIRQQEVVNEKQRATIQRNASQMKEQTLKEAARVGKEEAARVRKEKENARENEKQLMHVKELEQHINELMNQVIASKQEADERLNDYKAEKERADRLHSECENQKKHFASHKSEIVTQATHVSNSALAGSALQRQSRVTSEHLG